MKHTKIRKQNQESTEGCSKSIVRKNNDKFGKRLVSTSRIYASPKWTRCPEEYASPTSMLHPS